MTSELIEALLRANLAVSAAVMVVLALRSPAARLFGAQTAYALWSLVPLAWAGSLLPARTAAPGDSLAAQAPAFDPQWAQAAGVAWLTGVAVALALFGLAQLRFWILQRKGRAGPAVAGVFFPRLVLPKDFRSRYTGPEQALIRAHEAAHLERGDLRVNALMAAFQAVNWFNPLVHVAAARARLDQELACDETVLAARPTARRAYAEALLKTQLAACRPPLGCQWLGRGRHPLETRIARLAAAAPAESRRLGGALTAATLALTAGVAAWSAQPARPAPEPRVIIVQAPPVMHVLLAGPDALPPVVLPPRP
ncbi:M56 family metallopeptidase [Phenylobacterium sp.]|jgi:beta-lactamase regulating signal transducer with metallopeptidase domain|uniref:M56 family metallopeptidase n=1 Tax=Phenylobacterium sp. TaxID=1871053 RepID=UPI002E32E517|nr:M56 family metallopeptidase [Phenylobacterium sp.]HEX2560337.1 M56 family metallopeptidase [Phenylobacterium sp.]